MSDSESRDKTADQKVMLMSQGQRLSKADKAKLEAAGWIVVCVKYPADVRMLSEEPLPFTSDMLLRSALTAMQNAGSQIQANAWMSLARAVLAQEKKQ